MPKAVRPWVVQEQAPGCGTILNQGLDALNVPGKQQELGS